MIVSAVLQSGKVYMCIISFKTVTAAQNARSVLRSAGIASSVVSVDPNLTKRGCSFGLSLSSYDKNAAKTALDKKGISYGDMLGG
ncbi:MAG: DUF3343 domain-containing protein [Clostridia bacterium]|nr:DUF3343 domain-containing protein [Clostridia bacterium]